MNDEELHESFYRSEQYKESPTEQLARALASDRAPQPGKPFTIPTDAVTLHRWSEDGLGEQIGDPITVTEPGRVSFPPYRGERGHVQVAAWYSGEVVCRVAFAPRFGAHPFTVDDGAVVSVAVPFTGTLSF